MDEPITALDDPIWMAPPAGSHWRKVSAGEKWTKGDVVANNRLKLELFDGSGSSRDPRTHMSLSSSPGSSQRQVASVQIGAFTTTASMVIGKTRRRTRRTLPRSSYRKSFRHGAQGNSSPRFSMRSYPAMSDTSR